MDSEDTTGGKLRNSGEGWLEMSKPQTQSSRFERDREIINNPMRWPQMRLPMKNPKRYNTDRPSLGWLFAGMEWQDDERTVHLGNIFDKGAAGTEVYRDTEEMLDDGWTVD